METTALTCPRCEAIRRYLAEVSNEPTADFLASPGSGEKYKQHLPSGRRVRDGLYVAAVNSVDSLVVSFMLLSMPGVVPQTRPEFRDLMTLIATSNPIFKISP